MNNEPLRPRRRVIKAHRFLGLSYAYADIELECGHFVPGTSRQANAKTVGCYKCDPAYRKLFGASPAV